jgi:hypothetical protein
MRWSLLLVCVALSMCAGNAVYADWSRDVPVAINLTDGPVPNSLDRGAVVADVKPEWAGKEIIEPDEDGVWIMSGDNSQNAVELPAPQLTQDGHRLWIEDIPAVGDVNGDGILDIVVTECTKFLQFSDSVVYSSVVWWLGPSFTAAHNTPVTQHGLRVPTICRTGWQNGHANVAFFGYNDQRGASVNYSISVFDLTDWTNVQRYDEQVAMNVLLYDAAGPDESCVAAGDVDGDGYDELVFNYSLCLYCRHFNTQTQTWSDLTGLDPYTITNYNPFGRFMTGGTVLADGDADGHLEIFVGAVEADFNPVRLLQIRTYPTVQLLRAFGTADNPGDNQYHPAPAFADVSPWTTDPTSTLYPLLMTNQHGRAYHISGSLYETQLGWPFSHSPGFGFAQVAPALADVYGTDRPEIIYSGKTTTSGGQHPSYYKLYDFANVQAPLDSVLLTAVPNFAAGMDLEHRATPTVADVDNDGQVELVMSTRHHTPNQLPLDPYNQEITVADRNAPYSAERVYWSQFQNGPEHKGLYAQPVSGVQPLKDAKWSGRIVVTSDYTVPSGHILTIEPGTVVEFRSDANLVVLGSLSAVGTVRDSIYFKADGASPWGSIILEPMAGVSLDYCVIHGGSGIDSHQPAAVIRHCRIEGARP